LLLVAAAIKALYFLEQFEGYGIEATLGYYEITACENDRDDTTSTSR